MVDEIERRIRERQNQDVDIPQTVFLMPDLIVRESSIRKL